ncbi:MAG: DUF6252 family protein [Chitinophagaceae bacterium]|nr:DUF6252 family protein [Chitinophagaceae bacterium]
MKYIMKLSSIVIACFVLSLSACKKDIDTSSSYLKGKVDGVAFDCNSNIWATRGDAGDKIISFRGNVSPWSFQFYLDGQGSNITAGTYNFQTGIEHSAVLYQNSDGYSAGYFCSLGSPCSFRGSGKIIIQEITKKYIKGTFEYVTDVNAATSTFKTVTNGEFNIKREY